MRFTAGRDICFVIAIFLLSALLPPIAYAGPPPECHGHVATIVGTNGPNDITGTSGDDVIVGLGGNDVIVAKGGDDTVCGGNGDDALRGNDGSDHLFGNDGSDHLVGDDGSDVLAGGAGDDRAQGGNGQDTMRGGPGVDKFTGEDNSDDISGGSGNDRLGGQNGDDDIKGRSGNDFLNGGPNTDDLNGGPDIDHCVHGEHVVNCEQGPGPSPSPSTTTTPPPSTSPSPTTTPTHSPSPTPTTTTPTPTATPSQTTTPPPGGGGSPTPTPTPSVTPTPTPTPTPTVTPTPSADLSITKTDSPDPVTEGSELTYTLTLGNGGPQAASGVVATDVLPSSVTLLRHDPRCGSSGQTVTCSIGAMTSSATDTVLIVVQPNQPSTITNTASIGSATPDPDASNNTSTATTRVTANGTPTDCGQLQARLDASQSGDDILLHGICNGSFYLKTGVQITLEGDPSDGPDGFDGTGAPDRTLSGQNVMTTTIKKLLFRNSTTALGDGGALSLTGTSMPRIQDNEFLTDSAPSGWGGAADIEDLSGSGDIYVVGNTFGGSYPSSGNSASIDGGGLLVYGKQVHIDRNVFQNNSAGQHGGGFGTQVLTGGTADISGNSVMTNTAASGGGGGSVTHVNPAPSSVETFLAVASGYTALTDNVFSSNELLDPTDHLGGGLEVIAAGETIYQQGNVFDRNVLGPDTGGPSAGAGEYVNGSKLQSINDRFTNNSSEAANTEGGGLSFNSASGTVDGYNLDAAGNTLASGGEGAGIYVGSSVGTRLRLNDATISGNETPNDPDNSIFGTSGVFGDRNDILEITNTILYGNVSPTQVASDVSGFSASYITYSDVCTTDETGTAVAAPGVGNICEDPLLVNPLPGTADIHETPSSPTIDQGSNALVPPFLAFDYEGEPRIIDGDADASAVVDMGADEYQPPP